jgi:predicted MFS family arabinose efflux permease
MNSSHTDSGLAPGQVRRVIFLLACAAFASSAALRLTDPMLPALAAEFSTTIGRAALVVTATSIAYGLLQLLFGPLGDHFGKLKVITWACLASTLGALACAVSPDLESLALARALNGAATAALIPLSLAWIGDAVAFEQRQATLARFMSGQILGLVSGQALSGFFADTFGWRWAFVLLAGIYLVVGLLLWLALRRQHAVSSPTAHASGASGRFRLLLRDAHARFILAMVALEAVATFGAMTFIPAYLHQRFGISLFHAGLVVAMVGAGGLGYTLLAQHWVHRLGRPRLARLGGGLLGLAFLSLALAPDWRWGVLACALAGLGFYQFHNTLQTMATQMAPSARGTALSLFAFCFFAGQATGAALGAEVVDRLGAPWLFAASALILPLAGLALARHLKGLAR